MGAAAALASNGMAATIGKKELALALGWGRPRLDRELNRNLKFPVVSRGDQAGGWQFDLDAVRTYLGAPAQTPKATKAKTPPAIDKAQLRDAVRAPLPTVARHDPAPRRSAFHQGEATARARKDNADAELREDKLRESRGELVQREDVRRTAGDLFATLASELDGLAENIARRAGLSDEMLPQIRDAVDAIRIDLVNKLEPVLKEEDHDPGRKESRPRKARRNKRVGA